MGGAVEEDVVDIQEFRGSNSCMAGSFAKNSSECGGNKKFHR